MILERYYDAKLAQASYLIGCGETSSAIVVDPNRDIATYVRAAAAAGLRITHVTETHIHADFVSGARELAARTGATLLLSAADGPGGPYHYAADARAVMLADGDSFSVGRIRLDVLHTPGHTPEHVTFLVTDTAAADRPIGALTGDFVFVGDVGRPDLLERTALVPGSMDEAARTLFRSVQRFRAQPDWLQVWPGHGAGSACGKCLSAVPHTTVGYERRFNWAFAITDEDTFVRTVLAGQPEPPKYFADMKRLNAAGPPILDGFRRLPRLADDRLVGAIDAGAVVIDTRDPATFAGGHVPGTINIPLNNSFPTWAGWLVPYSSTAYLIVDESCANCLDEGMRDLSMIGLDAVRGYFGSAAVASWARSGRTLATVRHVTATELAPRVRDAGAQVIDVRGHAEWMGGHLAGARNIPLGYLSEHLGELAADVPLVVHCQGGARSAIAASVLAARGFSNVVTLAGGVVEWERSGFPLERSAEYGAAQPVACCTEGAATVVRS